MDELLVVGGTFFEAVGGGDGAAFIPPEQDDAHRNGHEAKENAFDGTAHAAESAFAGDFGVGVGHGRRGNCDFSSRKHAGSSMFLR
jgi:hypothetical protein